VFYKDGAKLRGSGHDGVDELRGTRTKIIGQQGHLQGTSKVEKKQRAGRWDERTHVTVGLLESLGSLLLVASDLLHQDLNVLYHHRRDQTNQPSALHTYSPSSTANSHKQNQGKRETNLLVDLSRSRGSLDRVLRGSSHVNALEFGDVTVVVVVTLGTGSSLLLLLLGESGGLSELGGLVLVVGLGLTEDDWWRREGKEGE
jgi:hypothetical protein